MTDTTLRSQRVVNRISDREILRSTASTESAGFALINLNTGGQMAWVALKLEIIKLANFGTPTEQVIEIFDINETNVIEHSSNRLPKFPLMKQNKELVSLAGLAQVGYNDLTGFYLPNMVYNLGVLKYPLEKPYGWRVVGYYLDQIQEVTQFYDELNVNVVSSVISTAEGYEYKFKY